MIGFFPQIYPDELVYSWFARYYAASGYSAYIYAITDLYESRAVRPDVEFINKLNGEAERVLTTLATMDEMIGKHTMLPYYGRFLPVERRKRAYAAMFNMDSSIHNLLAMPTNRKGNASVRYVRYCPLCAKEDREQYGETYIHRNHQMVNVDVCYRHHCRLKETEIPISGKASPRLYVMDSLVRDMTAEPVENEKELTLAEYVSEVFQSEVALDNPVSTGDFLHAKLAGTPYRSVRGQQRNISLLHTDYRRYYQDMPQKGITELWQIQKVLNGYRFNTYEICQLAMFLGIPVSELVNMSLPEKTQEQSFDERVLELRSQGLKYPAIAKALGASINVVKPIGEGAYCMKARKGRRENKGGVKGFDWEQVDQEMLPFAEEAARKIYHNDGNRPHRVNPSSVSKVLNLADGRLKNMPECMKVIQKYAETQQHYWAREVVWAVRVIHDSGDSLNWKRIRVLTNMKKGDLESCLLDLKKLDSEVWEQVRNVL